MPKSFEFKKVKEQIDFFRKLLNDLKEANNIKQNYYQALSEQIGALISYGFFADLVEKGLNGNCIDFNDKKISNLLSNIYCCIYCTKYTDVCNSLLKVNGSLIESYILSLSYATNPIAWMFASKNKKAVSEDAYNKLVKLRDDKFCYISSEVLNKILNLEHTNYEIVKQDYIENLDNYKQCVDIIKKKMTAKNDLVPILKKYADEYYTIVNKLNSIKNSIQDSKNEIDIFIKKLIADELIQTLRNIPVDELSREKAGLKIKYLREGGYNTLADVFVATAMQLSSVYGISDDAAYSIKSICDNYAKKINKDIKIKLSLDNKTKSATKVVQAIYTYIKKSEYSKKIDELNKTYDDTFENAFDKFESVGNGVNWLFISNSEVDNIRFLYSYVIAKFNSDYKPTAKNICKEFNSKNLNANKAWDNFAINSIQYYNIIEEISPGVLGTDDSIYGLPKELVRQIQDECYFPDGLLCTLRKYQEWGVKYILHQEKVLLGDEMGLGKTIQAIATMVSLKNTGATHFLVVCPASVVTNWCREIPKHSMLKTVKIHGNNKSSAFKSWLKTGGVAVTNYESTAYIKFEENYKFSLLVVDEAHYIKNVGARRSNNTREISKHADRLLFMTGTALENNVDEMISLIEVLNPIIANSVKHLAFMSSAPQFREEIAPVYYRRKREDVLTELPDKIESKEWCTLNPEEKSIYEDSVLKKRYQDARRVSWNIDDLSKSSKALRLKEIVEEAKNEGRKVIVFSYFLDTIRKIHDYLIGKCLNPINGSVNVSRRQEIIDEFDNAPTGTVLLAQINSGGTGLNIQSASVVVICEPQFKPSIENQAISRAYRMGQSRNVLVYRLLCENTVDEKLINLLESKQNIFDAFADKSVAGQKSLEVDDKAFSNIIKEEIDRINKERGISSKSD